MAYSGAQITRQGLSATPRGLYGSFAGKTPATGVPPNAYYYQRLLVKN